MRAVVEAGQSLQIWEPASFPLSAHLQSIPDQAVWDPKEAQVRGHQHAIPAQHGALVKLANCQLGVQGSTLHNTNGKRWSVRPLPRKTLRFSKDRSVHEQFEKVDAHSIDHRVFSIGLFLRGVGVAIL